MHTSRTQPVTHRRIAAETAASGQRVIEVHLRSKGYFTGESTQHFFIAVSVCRLTGEECRARALRHCPLG